MRIYWGAIADRLPADEFLRFGFGAWSCAIDVGGRIGVQCFSGACLCFTFALCTWLMSRVK